MARRTATRRRFLKQVGDPSDPQGMFAFMQHYLEYLGVKGYTPTGIYNVERYVRAFIYWCEPHALTRPRQVTEADIESYQRYLFHHRKNDVRPPVERSPHATVSHGCWWHRPTCSSVPDNS